MIKIKLVKLLIFFFLISACGYSPIFSNKENNFSVVILSSTGNNKLNKILEKKLSKYTGIDNDKFFTLEIDTKLNKTISTKDSKGNPKTFTININSIILIKDSSGKLSEKKYYKSINYNNSDDKFDLHKYENKIAKNLIEKISEELIIYLQSV